MGLRVTFLSGPRHSGKSALSRMMIARLYKQNPHYIRLVDHSGDKKAPSVEMKKPASKYGVATASWLDFDPERIIEVLSDTLTAIHKSDRYGTVLIEADADPALRCAYPYDHRIFVMPVPSMIEDVFRDPQRAAVELQRVLDDTASFASEIFGLFSGDSVNEVDPSEERVDMSDSQMRHFLYSPLGDELATRIQLQPAYHGLVESDVVIVNSGIGVRGPKTKECLRRITHLLERTRGQAGRQHDLFTCDLREKEGKVDRKLLRALRPMCLGGK